MIARGDAICSSAARAIHGTTAPTGTSSAALARYLGHVAPILAREATALNGLPRPAVRRSQLEAFLASETTLAADYGRLAAAARAGNESTLQRSLNALEGVDAAALARRYGLDQCTGAIATVR